LAFETSGISAATLNPSGYANFGFAVPGCHH
jgi:hypothetical protein